jgi:outer membrane protein OmpU
MNNLKKIGLTALGTALVAGSAQAATMSVSGGTSLFFGGEDNSNSGNGWSMTDQVTFTASGEMDNGFTISTSLQLDASVWDDRSLTIDTGDMGTLVFSGHGSSGPVGAWDDLTPSANEESWGTSIGGTVDGPTNAAVGDNSFIYDYSVSDALAIKAAYKPSKGTALQSSTEMGVAYTGIDGLTLKAAVGENNTLADQIDLSVFSAVYAMGPITVGYQTNESDRGTGTDEDFTAMGVSYQVNDDVAVSYGVSYQVNDAVAISYGASSIDYESSTKEDQDSSAVSISFTAGGVAISASHQSTDNVAGTATADNTSYEINFSFAF